MIYLKLHETKSYNSHHNHINLHYFLSKNLGTLNLTLFFFFDKLNLLSKKIITAYLDHLIINLNYLPKKVFNIFINILVSQINKNKHLILNSGLKKVKLKGFKIQLKGRYELSKSSLAKKICFKFGRLTINNLSNNLELINKFIYSKLGKSSLKI